MNKSGIMLPLLMTVILGTAFAASGRAKTEVENLPDYASKVKTAIYRLGVGEETRVSVKLYNENRFSGYISRASEKSFEVIDLKTGEQRDIPYQHVKQVKGHNHSTSATIGAGLGITLLLLYLITRFPD